MLIDHIETQIYEKFGYNPTQDQKKVIKSFASYLSSSSEGQIFMLNGYAGTGKTTLLGAVVEVLKSMQINVVLLAPTGRAAKVFSQHSSSAAFTIHKKIYRQKSIAASGGRFTLDYNKDKDTIYIVDEASMLSNSSYDDSSFGSGHLIDDLLDYVNSGENNRLILVGDDAQLPPVGFDFSPALNPLAMGAYGQVEYATLSEVMRQGQNSSVLHNATLIRQAIDQDEVRMPSFELFGNDVVRIGGADLIDALEDSYSRAGVDNTIIITRSNKRAIRFNEGVRHTVLDYQEQMESGERLMVVKNNYYYAAQDKNCPMEFIANGDVAVVERIFRTSELYGFNFAYVALRFDDYHGYRLECWVLMDTLHSESPSLSREQQESLFRAVEQDYIDEPNRGRRYRKIMENEYFNALQVKFAYAVTCHKAQGGQWSRVFLDTMLFGQEPMTRDFQRWLYTALTRATEKLYLVNWDSKFFADSQED
ncbi:MAG: AAA family ATPase [Mucinivorans sp.]